MDLQSCVVCGISLKILSVLGVCEDLDMVGDWWEIGGVRSEGG